MLKRSFWELLKLAGTPSSQPKLELRRFLPKIPVSDLHVLGEAMRDSNGNRWAAPCLVAGLILIFLGILAGCGTSLRYEQRYPTAPWRTVIPRYNAAFFYRHNAEYRFSAARCWRFGPPSFALRTLTLYRRTVTFLRIEQCGVFAACWCESEAVHLPVSLHYRNCWYILRAKSETKEWSC